MLCLVSKLETAQKFNGNFNWHRIELEEKNLKKYWMRQVWTIFLHATNDRIIDEYMNEDNHVLIVTKAPTLPKRLKRIFLK